MIISLILVLVNVLLIFINYLIEFDDLNKTWLLKDIAYNTQLGNSCMQ